MAISEKLKSYNTTYTYNREKIPFPEMAKEKAKPPIINQDFIDTKDLLKEKTLSNEQKAQEYMDNYRKAERALVINFYTGGTKYSRGILDSIYRGATLM